VTWIRLYTDILNHTGVQRLSALAFKTLVGLWCIAGKQQHNRLPPASEVAWMLRTEEAALSAQFEELEHAGLLDREGADWLVHNWQDRQQASDSSAGRVRAYRERKRESADHVVCNVTNAVTPTVTDAVTVTPQKERIEREKERTPYSPPAGDGGGVSLQLVPERTKEKPIPAGLIRIGRWFKRRETTRPSEKELRAYRAVGEIDPEDFALMEKYYLAPAPGEGDHRRHDLSTLLNNWPGELDRARRWEKLSTPDRRSVDELELVQ